MGEVNESDHESNTRICIYYFVRAFVKRSPFIFKIIVILDSWANILMIIFYYDILELSFAMKNLYTVYCGLIIQCELEFIQESVK